MADNSYDTPQSTRSLYSKHRETVSNFFDAERRLAIIEPSEEEFDACLRAAIAMTAYAAGPGEKSSFASPEQIIDQCLGIDSEASAGNVDRELHRKSTQLLKLAFKLKDEIGTDEDEQVSIQCRGCDDGTITGTVGTLPKYGEGGLEPSIEPRIVSFTIDCACQSFSPDEYERIEDHLLDVYVREV